MTLYHGTIQEYADKIVQEGLKSVPEQAFNMGRSDSHYSLEELRAEGYDTVKPHVTPYREVAEEFARFRAEYEVAGKGDGIVFPGCFLCEPFVKTAVDRKVEAKPVVVEVELPEYWREWLYDDRQHDQGLVVDRNVPAEYIKGWEEI